jgi:hypothetical protein
LVFKEYEAESVREQALQRQDANSRQAAKELEKDLEGPIARITAAVRNMEILGQVLRNNPGHLDGERKLQIALETYEVGARSWAWLLDLLAQAQKGMIEEFAVTILRDSPQTDMLTFVDEIRDTMVGLIQFASIGIVKRIARSIGSPDLDATYKKLVESLPKEDAPKLVRASILLDHMPLTPEAVISEYYEAVKKRPLAAWVLRNLVYEHMHMYHLDVRVKQRLCQSVEIEYQPAKLLASPKKN